MIDPALTHLMRMLMRAGLRQAWRLVKRPSGAVFVVFLLAMTSFGLIPTVVMAFVRPDQPQSMFTTLLTSVIPVLMYAMAAAMIATDSGDALLELKPPELQFVLAGPFTNSHILSYRLLTLLLGWLPLSAFFAVFMLPHFGSMLGAFLGISLGGAFITLIAFQYTLVKSKIAPGVLRAIRLFALLSVAVIAIEACSRVMRSDEVYSTEMIAQSINGGWAAGILTSPFRPFAGVMASGMDLELVYQTALSLGLILVIATSCYQTNGGFAELAVEGVARRQKKLERIKGGNVYGVSVRKKERTQLLPAFPWIGGVGPVAWTQMTSAIRRSGRLAPGLILLGIVVAMVAAVLLRVFPDRLPVEQRKYAVPIALAASIYVGFLFALTAQTGFTSNRRLLTWYQTLPIRSTWIATGMVTGTFTLLFLIQVAFCLPAFVITTQSWIESLSLLFAGASFSLAFSTMTNFIAATFDLRPAPQGTPDVFQGARALLFMLVLGITMTPIVLVAVGGAGVAGALFGFSWVYCPIAGAAAMLSVLPPLWWYSGVRFVQSEFSGD